MKCRVLIIHNSARPITALPKLSETLSAYKSNLNKFHWKLHVYLYQWRFYYTIYLRVQNCLGHICRPSRHRLLLSIDSCINKPKQINPDKMLHYFWCINEIESCGSSRVGWISGWSFLSLPQCVFFLKEDGEISFTKLPLTLPWLMEESLGSPNLPGHSCSFRAGLLGWLVDLGVLFSVPAQWTNTNIPSASGGALAAVGCWFWLGLSPVPSGVLLPRLGLQILWVNKSHPLQQALGYLCLCFLLSQWLWEISI